MEEVKIYIPLIESKIVYMSHDGKKFDDYASFIQHERFLRQLRLEWYNKRWSILGELKYFLFGIEPKKPYNF